MGVFPAELYDAHACGLPDRQPARVAAARFGSPEIGRQKMFTFISEILSELFLHLFK